MLESQSCMLWVLQLKVKFNQYPNYDTDTSMNFNTDTDLDTDMVFHNNTDIIMIEGPISVTLIVP